MPNRLTDNITSSYLAAAQHLRSQNAKKKIVAYVESYDDILFWRRVLSDFEDSTRYFEVMLPSRNTLGKGKRMALMNSLGERFGKYMIACVDADYDYMMQGSTEMSRKVCSNPYVFHTYAYAIENFQCYAPSLHDVCVMATLNDHDIFDFRTFIENFSRILHPLFGWSIWCYKYGFHNCFTIADMSLIFQLDNINLYHPEQMLETIRHRVNRKINQLQRQLPQAKSSYKPLMKKIEELGVKPEETYLYMRGHDIYDKVIMPLLTEVCESLRREREREIHRLAEHKCKTSSWATNTAQEAQKRCFESILCSAKLRSSGAYNKI